MTRPKRPPSVIAGPVGYPRAYLDRRLGENGEVKDAAWLLSEHAVEQLKSKSADEVKKWYTDNRAFLHPGADQKLEVDEDARALGAPIDRVEFFEKAIAVLRAGGDQSKRVERLLARYAPTDAGKKTSASAWEEWFKENRLYVFFSDQGDYRWYVDPLAKRRGVPSKELRGSARASRHWQPVKKVAADVRRL